MADPSLETRFGQIEESNRGIQLAISKMDAKIEILTGILSTIKVLETKMDSGDKAVARAFLEIQEVAKHQEELTKKVLDVERTLDSKFSFINGVLCTIAIVWTVVGGGIIWMGARLIQLAIGAT